MSELTEFLLARIAEQEAAAKAGGHGWLEVSDYILREPRPDAPIVFTEARVLAECAAKRQIVAMFPHAADGDGWNNAGEEVLMHLAAIYADHPDYRAEWVL